MSEQAKKLVLVAPIENHTLLAPYVEQALVDNVVLISGVGEGCAQIEDEIDWLLIENGTDPKRFIITTAHPDESLADVIEFVRDFYTEPITTVQIIGL